MEAEIVQPILPLVRALIELLHRRLTSVWNELLDETCKPGKKSMRKCLNVLLGPQTMQMEVGAARLQQSLVEILASALLAPTNKFVDMSLGHEFMRAFSGRR